jgi:hypothetical protein
MIRFQATHNFPRNLFAVIFSIKILSGAIEKLLHV